MTASQIIALVIFVAVIAVIVSEKLHRAACALIGAMLLVLLGILEPGEALDFIDFNTIGVLLGMMMFVAVVKNSGIFEFLAVKAAKLAKGNPWRIMVYFMIITAVLSAFLDNVTTVLLIGPMTFSICKTLELNPVPYLMTQIISSNVGGTATLIGDPPNIMLGSAADISFLQFVIYDGPIVVIVMIATVLGFRILYGKRLSVSPEKMELVCQMDEKAEIKDHALFIKSIVMILVVATAFILHDTLELKTSIIALSCAAIMIMIGRQDVEETVHDVEWPTIVFFAFLFVVVGGLEKVGLIRMLADAMISATGTHYVILMIVILWVSALCSAVLDNIPFVATLIPLIMTMQSEGIDVWPLWWAVSIGACFGGNGTIIGASANVVLTGISNRKGYPITFMDFLKVGAPMMIMSIVLATIYLLILFGGYWG
ncbi:MAG: ArsB/NhaD family transporter [Clostridiales bacterium]|nr:ArsB/NhaD family transporter [Clostridiales bacterium]MDD7035470.1 ArsB/NhaD family transporter [Bacillota bacterium]MDY2919947.1 ArsB/NhaD family transporter [Lentihominibacter sp.]